MKNLFIILFSAMWVFASAQNELFINGDNNSSTTELFINDKTGSSSTLFINGEYKNVNGTVKNNESLIKITGDFNNISSTGGEYSSQKGELQFVGSSGQEITGDKIDAHYVVLDNASGSNITGGCNLNIDSALVLSEGNYSAAAGSETVLLSNPGGDAYLDDFTGTGSYTGDIIVERYVNNGTGNDQHLVASPVNTPSVGTLADDLLGPWGSGLPGGNLNALTPTATCDPNALDPSSDYGNLFQWDANLVTSGCAQEGWIIRSAGTLENGRGYSAYLPVFSTADFEGTPNSGAVSYAGTLSGTIGGLWLIVGNPYPSPMVWTAPAGIEAIAKIYNVTGPYFGTYSDVNPGSVLAIGQGFSVKSGTAGAYNFALDNGDRTVGSANWKSNNARDYEIQVDVRGNGFADKSSIFFASNTALGFDPMHEDGAKRAARAGQPYVYSIVDGEPLSTNGMPTSSYGQHSIPLGVHPGVDGILELEFFGMDSLPASSLMFLEDKLLNSFTDLRNNPIYSFEMTTTELEDRFELHLLPAVEVNSIGESCAGNDAQILLDFGSHTLDNNPIAWDYVVSLNGLEIANSTSSGINVLDNLSPGSYDVELTYGNVFVQEQVEVLAVDKVQAAFLASELSIEEGESIDFTNLSTLGHAYTWTINYEEFTSYDLSYIFEDAGEYEVQLAVNSDDCQDAESLMVTVNPKQLTSIRDNELFDKLDIYAFGHEIFVDLSNIELRDETFIDVFNIIGQEIIAKFETQNQVEVINMNTASDGYYMVRVSNQDRSVTKKVFITND